MLNVYEIVSKVPNTYIDILLSYTKKAPNSHTGLSIKKRSKNNFKYFSTLFYSNRILCTDIFMICSFNNTANYIKDWPYTWRNYLILFQLLQLPLSLLWWAVYFLERFWSPRTSCWSKAYPRGLRKRISFLPIPHLPTTYWSLSAQCWTTGYQARAHPTALAPDICFPQLKKPGKPDKRNWIIFLFF